MSGLMRAGGLILRGAYTWSNTSVKEKLNLSADSLKGGRGLIGGEIRYYSRLSIIRTNYRMFGYKMR